MSRTLLAAVVVGALGLTAFLVWGLLGNPDGPGEVGGDDDTAIRKAADEGAHLQGTGTAADLVVARDLDYRITGRVRDGDGEPLAGCRVGLQRHARRGRDPRDPSTWALPLRAGWGVGTRQDDERIDRPLEHGFAPEQVITSDEEGRFEVSVPQVGRYVLRPLVEPPRVGSTGTVHLWIQRGTAHVSLTVVKGAPLAGRVLDAHEQPVAAVVRGYVAGEGRARWTADPVATAPADGRFAWPALPAGKGTFQVTIPGRLVLRGLEVELPHDGVWTIRLDETAGAVAGRIVDGDGDPVADARLLVDTGDSLARATSGTDGAYRAEGLLAGRIQRVVVEAEGFGLQAFTPPLAPWAGAEVEEGKTTSIDVTLHAGATVQGVVREVGSGRPLADVEVFVLRRAGDQRSYPVPNAKTDAAGRYLVSGVPPGLHVLIARSPTHHLPQLESPQPQSFMMTPQGLPVAPGPPPELLLLVSKTDDTLTKDLQLAQGLTLEGRVVGPDDEPIAGAEVQSDQRALSQAAWRWGVSWPGWGVPLATTDERGHFAVHGMPPNDALPVRASKKPLTSGPAVTVSLKRGEPVEPLVIRLQPSVAVEGRVVDADGQGVAGWINAWSTAGGSGGYAYRSTEPDGTFRLEGLPAGGIRLQVTSEGYGSANMTLEPIPAGETKTDVEVRLRSGVRVSGVLVDQHGQPVANRSLSLTRPNGGTQVDVRTDETGHFETDHAPKGRLKATISEVQGNVSVPVNVGKPFDSPIDGLRLTLRVPERTIVEGTVVDPEGLPVPICRVMISRVVDGRVLHERNSNFNWSDVNEVVNGEFRREVKGEPPFEIEVSAPRGRDGRTLNLRADAVRVADPSAGPVQIRLEPGEELVGRVVDPKGQGVPNVMVQVFALMASTDADGKFRLGGLGGGPTHVQLSPPPGWVKPDGRTVPAGEELEVVLVPAAAIAGTVKDEEGNPVTDYARVETSWKATGDTPSGRVYGTAMNGTFRIDGIPRGVQVHLIVTVYGQNGSTAPVTYDVEAGDEDIQVVVGGGPVLAGVVVDEDGQPVVGASVSVIREGKSSAWTNWSQTTEEGRFRVSGVEPGRHHVNVRRPGENETAEMISVTAPNEEVRIQLAAPKTIRGRLVGGKEGATYHVQAWAEGIPDGKIGRRARVGADGTFEVQGLGRGSVALVVQKDDHFALSEPVEPGSTGMELRLREGERIAGTILGMDAESESFAWVTARGDRWKASVWTRDGKFELRGLPPGRYRLTARGQSRNSTGPEVEVATGSTNVQLRLP